MAFGFVGGAIGTTEWGEGTRSFIVGFGLGITEGGIGEIHDWKRMYLSPVNYIFDLVLGGS